MEIAGGGICRGYLLDGCGHFRRVECPWVSSTFSPLFIFALSSSHSKILGLDTKILRDNYHSWGPSLRNCLRFTEEPEVISAYNQDVFQIASELTKDPSHFIDFKSPSATHRIFVVRPSSNSRRMAIVEFGTNRLREIFARAYIQQDSTVRSSFYSRIREHPWFASPARQLIEIYVLLWFWHSRFNEYLWCTGTSARLSSLEIPSCQDNLKFFYMAEELKDISEPEKPICLVPTSRTFPTLSAVVLTSNAVITVQITIALKHDANEQEFDLIYRNLPPDLLKKRPKRFHAFITDNEINAKSLREQNQAQIPNGTLVYSTATGAYWNIATEERVSALEQARVSMYWSYAIWN